MICACSVISLFIYVAVHAASPGYFKHPVCIIFIINSLFLCFLSSSDHPHLSGRWLFCHSYIIASEFCSSHSCIIHHYGEHTQTSIHPGCSEATSPTSSRMSTPEGWQTEALHKNTSSLREIILKILKIEPVFGVRTYRDESRYLHRPYKRLNCLGQLGLTNYLSFLTTKLTHLSLEKRQFWDPFFISFSSFRRFTDNASFSDIMETSKVTRCNIRIPGGELWTSQQRRSH